MCWEIGSWEILGNRVFTKVVQLKRDHGDGPSSSMTGVPLGRGQDTHGKDDVKTQGEDNCPQALFLQVLPVFASYQNNVKNLNKNKDSQAPAKPTVDPRFRGLEGPAGFK